MVTDRFPMLQCVTLYTTHTQAARIGFTQQIIKKIQEHEGEEGSIGGESKVNRKRIWGVYEQDILGTCVE